MIKKSSTFFCLHWEIKGHMSRLNIFQREALLKDLHNVLQLLYTYAKETYNP